MRGELYSVFIIFLLSSVPFLVYGQDIPICGSGTILNPDTQQCLPKCGEGTTQNDKNECVTESEKVDWGQIEYIAVGIITGVGATVFGIMWTIIAHRAERKKEDLELIQEYGNQISEITQVEGELETQLDCSLYAERYLDTLDQIASLLEKKLIRYDVADYFENNFKYGMNLWYWYKENVEKISKDFLKDEFSKGVKEVNKIIKDPTFNFDWNQYYKDKEESEVDRWYYFRWWCNLYGNI